MKGLLFVITAFCMIFLSCSFSSQNRVSQKRNNDTVVCSKRIYDEAPLEDWEYFVVNGKDTSVYSCLITSKNGKWSSMRLCLTFNGKYYFFLEDRNENDTTAVGGIRNMPKSEFVTPSYKNMLHEIDMCLESASERFELSTLHGFNSFLSYLGDIAVLTTNNLNSHFVEEEGEYLCVDITKALKMTSFIDDLNEVFKKYGFEIEDVSCGGMKEIFEKDVFLGTQNISKEINVPDSIIDVEVYVGIKKLENAD